MNRLIEICSAIAPVDREIAAQAQQKLDFKTKPRRSLGRLEDLACQFAAISATTSPALPTKAIVVMGADHGVVEEGISAYPQEVTAQMLLNFARGGAAINVLARHAGARVVVVDMGVKHAPQDAPEIRSARVAPGTANFTKGPAMSEAQALQALTTGIALAEELAREGITLLGIGDMGIGNTTASSALTAVLTGAAVAEVTGHGTGIDTATHSRKIDAIQRAIAHNRPDAQRPLQVLAQLGGFEIAGLAGVVLGAAQARLGIVVDGFIASVAALVAVRLAPAAADYLFASHRSVEAGHRLVLEQLGKRPLLDLELRLGEGTGAALAMGLIDAALHVLQEMATFEGAGVTDTGR